MARIYKLIEYPNDPKRPTVTTTVIEVTDDVTKEVLRLPASQIQGTGLNATTLAEAVGRLEADVMGPRATGKAELAAIIEAGGVITPIAPKAPTTNEQNHQQFHKRLRKLLTLKQLGTTDPTLVSAMTTLQGQVETYIKANPDAI